ncbi:MAG: DUF2845 domain-containing protein [Methylococcaceae bacterium]|nr:DUF2845 domain-containing protein [Methylococcaceae bacterium]
MKKGTAVWVLLWLALQPQAWALHCGHQLVNEGDYKMQVLQKCGEPDYKESRMGFRGERLGSGFNQPGMDFLRGEQVLIDEWTYDFGPHRFMQWLYFENGRLVLIKDLGYGTVNGSE